MGVTVCALEPISKSIRSGVAAFNESGARRLEDVVDAPAQHGPVALRDIEVTTEIEQGALSHLRADAFGAHEAEGEIVLGVAADPSAPDEHGGAR